MSRTIWMVYAVAHRHGGSSAYMPHLAFELEEQANAYIEEQTRRGEDLSWCTDPIDLHDGAVIETEKTLAVYRGSSDAGVVADVMDQ